MPERIWIMEELNILHTMDAPIVVFTAGIMEDPHSARGIRDTYRCLFQNSECAKLIGTSRTQEAYSKTLAAMADNRQRQWYAWVKGVMENQTQDAWTPLQMLEPVLDMFATDRSVRVVSKPIKIKVRQNQVESAIMCQIKTEHNVGLVRTQAMHKRTPVFTFMFGKDGNLLNSNAAAMKKFRVKSIDDGTLHLKDLFHNSTFPGGAAEAEAAYEEAFDAVFNLAVESYRHPVPQISKKNGQQKWSMIEMWPMTDPVTDTPAVLVFVHNITQQKQMEMQLAQRQEALQRENQDLEQNRIQMEMQTAVIRKEKEAFQQEALDLAKRLEAVIHDKFIPKSHINADTPIDKTLNFLHAFVAGENPSVQEALDVYHILTEGNNDLRQPVGLETQLLKESSMDSEVGMSMLQLLSGPTAFREGGSAVPSEGTTKSLSRTTSMLKPTDRTHNVLASEASLTASLIPVVERLLLEAETNWQFDIFGFAEQAQGNALSLLSFHFMQKFGNIQKLGFDHLKLATFVRVIEKGYDPKNPYHNSTHVASVVQMTHLLLHQGGVASIMNENQICATYMSALTHDFEHLGVNNDYLIKSFHPLSVMYNDISPLENHHLAAATRVMQRPDCRFVKDLSPETSLLFRPILIQQVLGTDMKKHFEILSRFQTAFKRSAPTSAPDTGGNGGCPEAAEVIDWDSVKPDDKILVFQMLLKCADIGHLAADQETHKKWAYQLEEEFFQQGDREKEIGLTVSPLMDRRHKGGITRSQMGFFTIVGLPMFKAMADVFEGAKPMLEGVMGNYRAWEAAAAAAESST